ITEVNEALLEQPELVNSDPFGKGWLFKMKPANKADLADLLDADEYEASLPLDDED
ncbi:MAG TPA: glycine cleavage system protein H, partial [Kiritimatiellia bacterium]|nr:glycine cleavage system protein H [Kiritimatiellia bacterium]